MKKKEKKNGFKDMKTLKKKKKKVNKKGVLTCKVIAIYTMN